MIEILFTILILVLAIPLGFWIAWLARDELRVGRRWFMVAIIGGALLALAAAAARQAAAAYAGIFIAILASVAYQKSFDRTWARTTRT